MFSNKLALTALGATCIMAAGVGGYLAQRQNTSSAPLQASSSLPKTIEHPVQETEARVVETPASVSAAKPAPARPVPAPAATTSRSVRPATAEVARAGPPAPVDRPGPVSAPPAPVPAPAIQVEATTPQAQRPLETVERVAPEPALLPEPPQKSYEELVVSADS